MDISPVSIVDDGTLNVSNYCFCKSSNVDMAETHPKSW